MFLFPEHDIQDYPWHVLDVMIYDFAVQKEIIRNLREEDLPKLYVRIRTKFVIFCLLSIEIR